MRKHNAAACLTLQPAPAPAPLAFVFPLANIAIRQVRLGKFRCRIPWCPSLAPTLGRNTVVVWAQSSPHSNEGAFPQLLLRLRSKATVGTFPKYETVRKWSVRCSRARCLSAFVKSLQCQDWRLHQKTQVYERCGLWELTAAEVQRSTNDETLGVSKFEYPLLFCIFVT